VVGSFAHLGVVSAKTFGDFKIKMRIQNIKKKKKRKEKPDSVILSFKTGSENLGSRIIIV